MTTESLRGAWIGPAWARRDFAPVLKWLLVTCVVVFGLLALWQFGLIQTMIDTDHTRVSLFIGGLFLLTTLHCLFQTAEVSRELVTAREVREAVAEDGASGLRLVDGEVRTVTGRTLKPGAITTHIANLLTKSKAGGGGSFDQTLLLRALADRLRSREKLGLFVSEALLRLALLGTAIGFILMLIPISQLTSFEADKLRAALAGMTSGMAIALNVTVAGIASALVLKFEYYLLDGAIAELFESITETTEVHVIPALKQPATHV